jgi:hypothetical protein
MIASVPRISTTSVRSSRRSVLAIASGWFEPSATSSAVATHEVAIYSLPGGDSPPDLLALAFVDRVELRGADDSNMPGELAEPVAVTR